MARQIVLKTILEKSAALLGAVALALTTACAQQELTPKSNLANDFGKTANDFTRALDSLNKLPTTELAPMGPKEEDTEAPAFNIYRIKEVKVRGTKKRTVIARLLVATPDGDEAVDLAGRIRSDLTATLIDLNPPAPNQHRLTVEVSCATVELNLRDTCTEKIVDVYYKIEGSEQLMHRQFVDKSLANPEIHTQLPRPDSTPRATPARPDATDSTTAETQQSPNQPPTAEAHSEDEDEGLPDVDLDPRWRGEYVGSSPNSGMLDKLKAHAKRPDPVVPKPPLEQLPPLVQPEPVKPEPVKPEAVKSEPVVPQPAQPEPEPVKPQPAQPTQPEPAKPQAETKQEPQKREEPKKQPEKKPEKKKAPAKPTKKVDEDEEDDDSLPDAPQAPAKSQDAGKSLERQYAPLLNLRGGGIAMGKVACEKSDRGERRANCGSISGVSQLPTRGNGWRQVHSSRDTLYGAGILISFLQNGIDHLVRNWYQGTVVWINDIAKQGGGLFNERHRSHQNGLDVDAAYVGQTFKSVVESGRPNSEFSYAKNWQLFRLAASQKIYLKGEWQSALKFVFVGPAIKKGFCSWARANNLLQNEVDQEVMRRMREWPGHDDHFHLRMKCSPYYSRCYMQGEPAKGDYGC